MRLTGQGAPRWAETWAGVCTDKAGSGQFGEREVPVGQDLYIYSPQMLRDEVLMGPLNRG